MGDGQTLSTWGFRVGLKTINPLLPNSSWPAGHTARWLNIKHHTHFFLCSGGEEKPWRQVCIPNRLSHPEKYFITLIGQIWVVFPATKWMPEAGEIVQGWGHLSSMYPTSVWNLTPYSSLSITQHPVWPWKHPSIARCGPGGPSELPGWPWWFPMEP